MSRVKRELELLYCDVRELMSAANMAASIRPRSPANIHYKMATTILATNMAVNNAASIIAGDLRMQPFHLVSNIVESEKHGVVETEKHGGQNPTAFGNNINNTFY